VWYLQRYKYCKQFVHLYGLVQRFEQVLMFFKHVRYLINESGNTTDYLIFVVPCIMLYSSEISLTRCNNCVFILRNGFTVYVLGDNLTHHQEYICCIWPQVIRLT